MKTLRVIRNLLVAFLIGLTSPFLIWVGAGVAIYERRKLAATVVTCRIDSDCPSGHVCVNGRCVPSA